MSRTYLVPKVGAGTGADPFRGKFIYSVPYQHRALDFPLVGLMLLRTVDPPDVVSEDERAAHEAMLDQFEAVITAQPDVARVDEDAVLDRGKVIGILAGAGIDKEWLTGKLTAADVQQLLETDATTRQVAQSVTVLETQLADQQAKLTAQQKTLEDLKRAATAADTIAATGKKPK